MFSLKRMEELPSFKNSDKHNDSNEEVSYYRGYEAPNIDALANVLSQAQKTHADKFSNFVST